MSLEPLCLNSRSKIDRINFCKCDKYCKGPAELFYVPIRYQEGKIGYGMLDTGAAINTVSTQLAERWGLEILESESTGIWGITGRYVSSRGRIDVIINIFGDSFRLHAEVIESQEEIILGLPFLRANQILIDLSKQTLRFTFSAETNTKITKAHATKQAKGKITPGGNVPEVKVETDFDPVYPPVELPELETKTDSDLPEPMKELQNSEPKPDPLNPVDRPRSTAEPGKELQTDSNSENDPTTIKSKPLKKSVKRKRKTKVDKQKYPRTIPVQLGREPRINRDQSKNRIALGPQETPEKLPMPASLLDKTKPVLAIEYHPCQLAKQNISKGLPKEVAADPFRENQLISGKKLGGTEKGANCPSSSPIRVRHLSITASGTGVPYYAVKRGDTQVNKEIQYERKGENGSQKPGNQTHEPYSCREISNLDPTQVVHLNRVKNLNPNKQDWEKTAIPIRYDGHLTRRPVPSELPRPPEPTGIPYGKSVVSVVM